MKFIVGLDPGVSTGFALWNTQSNKLEEVSTLNIIQAMERCYRIHKAETMIKIIMEDARLRTWFGNKGREALQGAGSVKRSCQVLNEFCEHFQIPLHSISPQGKGAKVDAERFKQLTGWTGKTSEHGRDAAMLVWKRHA